MLTHRLETWLGHNLPLAVTDSLCHLHYSIFLFHISLGPSITSKPLTLVPLIQSIQSQKQQCTQWCSGSQALMGAIQLLLGRPHRFSAVQVTCRTWQPGDEHWNGFVLALALSGIFIDSSTDPKGTQTPHNIFYVFGRDKTFTTPYSDCKFPSIPAKLDFEVWTYN